VDWIKWTGEMVQKRDFYDDILGPVRDEKLLCQLKDYQYLKKILAKWV
jgi:hypothetical protein